MRIKQFLALVAIGLIGVFGQVQAAPELTGSAFCVSCHDDEDLPDMSQSAHAPSKKPPMAAAQLALSLKAMGDQADARTPTCITCHGASELHARKPANVSERPKPDKIFSKKSALPATERSAVCLSCHDKDASRLLWSGSQHQGADVACNSCHKVHANSDKTLTRATQTDTCYVCHKGQRAQMSRPSHHPVPEGKMSCSDCHNVHGSAGPKLAKRDSTNATCYSCHAEKRGPFVHQHEPVSDDCMNCHAAHGSMVQALLKARPPMLCQQCHTPHVAGGVGALGGQPGVRTPASPGQSAQVTALSSGKNVVNIWQGRSCMNCHTQVHGSNNPSATNPTPQFMLR